jgi:hypothetical protein
MNNRPPAATPNAGPAAMLVLMLLLAGALLLLPYTAVERMLASHTWLGHAIQQLQGWVPHLDVGHLLAFGGIGLALKAAFPRVGWLRAAAFLAAYGAATEIAQLLAPGRTPGWGDLGVDLLGGLAGFALASALLAAAANLPGLRRPA